MGAIPLSHLLKIGAETLQTSAKTLSGAVNELRSQINSNKSVTDSSITNLGNTIYTLSNSISTLTTRHDSLSSEFQQYKNSNDTAVQNKINKSDIKTTLANVISGANFTTVPSTSAIKELQNALNRMEGKVLWQHSSMRTQPTFNDKITLTLTSGSSYTATGLNIDLTDIIAVEVHFTYKVKSSYSEGNIVLPEVFTTGKVYLDDTISTWVSLVGYLGSTSYACLEFVQRQLRFIPKSNFVVVPTGGVYTENKTSTLSESYAVPFKIIGYYE